MEKLWEKLRGNYSQNQGRREENRMGENVFFERVLETAWPRSHQKIYGGGSCASVSATIILEAVSKANTA